MNYINRNFDCVTKNEDLEKLYTFKKFPVFMGCTLDDKSSDIYFDMEWKISKSSGLVQLNPVLPLELIYKNGHGSGTVGKLWDEHHKEFAHFLHKYNLKSVLEIGGLHGKLANNYLKLNGEARWTIIDPNATAETNKNTKVIKKFFDSSFLSDENYDSVVHSHVIEHIYDIDEFMNHISKFMVNKNLLLFSIPNLKVMLENKYANAINFEHTIYLTEPYLEYFLKKYGFELIEKKYFKYDHSIFYCAKKTNEFTSPILPENLYTENKNAILKYVEDNVEDVKKINKIIKNSTIPVFLFGAHVFTQSLIYFGLDTGKIQFVLDNSKSKENQRLYGTNLICKNPNILKKSNEKCIIILRAGFYTDEIKEDIIRNINKNVIFI